MFFFALIRRSWLGAAPVYLGLFVWVFTTFLFPCSLQASSSMALQKGITLYRSYQFEEAIPWFQKALRSDSNTLTKKQRLEAYLFLSICHYNQTQRKQAIETFEQALSLDADAKIPPHQAPHVFAYYETLRRDWKQRNPPPIQKLSIAAPKKPVAPAFRHTTSLSLLGAGVLVAGVGIVLQVVSLQQASTIETTRKAGTGLAVFDVYESANRTAWGAVGLWAVSGVLAGVAVGIFVHESRIKPKPSSLPSVGREAPRVFVGSMNSARAGLLWKTSQ